jgi:hypothetical protein
MNTTIFSWRVFVALLGLGCLALSLSFPPPPPPMVLAGGTAALAAAIALGLWLGSRYGLGAPLLYGYLHRNGIERSARSATSSLSIGAAVGLVLGVAILLSLRLGFVAGGSLIKSRFAAETGAAHGARWIIAFDAAVLEELIFRLFAVSLLVWILSGRWHVLSQASVPMRIRVAIVFVALGFAAAHLPKWLEFAPLSASLVSSVLVLNGIGGLAFGYVFMRFGIESAILSHFAADVVLHVVGPSAL